jgi:thioredoxin 1
MKKVTFFYVQGCPYCAQARKARTELINENPEYGKVEFDEIDEGAHPEIADQYDYWATPAMFIDGQKIYESHLGEPYDSAKENVKKVLDTALAE